MDNVIKLDLPPANLTYEETRQHIKAAQAGDKAARDRLIQANLRLVMSMAQRFAGRGGELEDLFQVGCLGLVEAVEHFDLRYDVRFSTYAVPRILGEIKRYLQKDRPVKIGRQLQILAGEAARAREAFTRETGRSPTVTELAARLGVAREDVVMALEATAPPASLDEMVNKDESDPVRLGEQLGMESETGIVVDNLALQQVFATLAAEERLLVALRFFRNMRQVDVAKEMGVSQAHISRMEQRILLKMRGLLA